jgi:hypothetical protein
MRRVEEVLKQGSRNGEPKWNLKYHSFSLEAETFTVQALMPIYISTTHVQVAIYPTNEDYSKTEI